MLDSLLTPSTSSHMQTSATTFDHEDFLNHIFASAPWPSVDKTHAPQPPPSDVFVDSRNQQIMMMPLSSHHQNDNVDGSSAHALYSGFSATGSRPFHIPQVINLNKSLSLSLQVSILMDFVFGQPILMDIYDEFRGREVDRCTNKAKRKGNHNSKRVRPQILVVLRCLRPRVGLKSELGEVKLLILTVSPRGFELFFNHFLS